MTPKGRRLFEFIQRYVRDHGFPPTLNEMTHGMGGRSNNEIREQLHRLEKAGAIQWTRRIARGIRVLNGANRVGQD